VNRPGWKNLERDAFEKAAAGIIAPQEVVDLGMGLAKVAAADSATMGAKRKIDQEASDSRVTSSAL
jgi:hypothetical protein